MCTFNLCIASPRNACPRPPALFARLFNPPHAVCLSSLDWMGEILQMYVISPGRVYTLDERIIQFLGGPFISLVPHTDRLLSEISRQVLPLSCRLSPISFVKSFHTFLRQKTSLFLPSVPIPLHFPFLLTKNRQQSFAIRFDALFLSATGPL